ncbi:GNAT family N-acetyltransferase [Cytobacillus purgationiresistens]|uniref:GNAT superfamily N-acetyltransferase n=1 Tax=Cytobacillus purgationiresistens TaxID=863449 RepID=A0ABU0AAE2_9BACI|nr:GNAT family N-acetyltransferase [Cytobacillus purgationiresistens]MDQ0268216.1 GNAT superfamily N-acetyltransferase [Cytobacillus purgationiresistens]
MQNTKFEQIHHFGETIFENHLYKHIHYPEMLVMYDANFLQFKRIPSLDEFRISEKHLMDFHLSNHQEHVKFYFPAQEHLPAELLFYLKQNFYVVGFLELYTIEPERFPTIINDPDIQVQFVEKENLALFLQLQKKWDLEHGEEFATRNQTVHLKNYHNTEVVQALAFYKGEPAGSVNVFLSQTTAEIDSLTVLETYRNKKIGSRLQQAVMKHYHDKTFILVADGEDTPREMYIKQGYQYGGFRYEAMKLVK